MDGNTGELGGDGNERIIHDTDGDANGMETDSNREAITVIRIADDHYTALNEPAMTISTDVTDRYVTCTLHSL